MGSVRGVTRKRRIPPWGTVSRMGTAARRSKNQAREHAAHWARAQTGALTYVALGDSVGVGVGVDDPEHGYVGTIAQRLAVTTGKTVRTVNLSVSGAKAQDVLETQIPELSVITPPDFVTCAIGGNDVAWTSFFRGHDFARTIHAIAGRLPENSVMGLVPCFVHWPYEARARKANLAIRAAAGASGHAVADIHGATKKLSLPSYLRMFADDYFHPNETGHQVWADAIWERLILDGSAVH